MPVGKKALTGDAIEVYAAQHSPGMLIDPVFKKVDLVSGAPARKINYTTSAQTSSNRQARKQIKESESFETSIEFEISEKTVRFLENAFMNSFTTFVNYTAAGTLSTDVANNRILDSANGFTDIQEGQMIFFSDVSDYNFPMGAVYVVQKVSDGELVVSDNVLYTDVVGVTATVKGCRITIGKEDKSLALQKRTENPSSPDDGYDYETQYDAKVSSLTLTVPSSGIMTGSISFIALENYGQGKVWNQTDVADVEVDVASACDGLDGEIFVDYQNSYGQGITEFSMELNNNIQTAPQAGRIMPAAGAAGAVTVSGTYNRIAFAENPSDDMYKYYNGTRMALTCPTKLPDGKRMYITIPQCLLTDASMGNSADEILQTAGTYTAERDALSRTVQIDLDFDPTTV